MTERIIHLTAKDFTVQSFRAGGKGGQKQNKTNSGARVIHPVSGARGESREERSWLQNRKRAFVRMTETDTFKNWLCLEHMRRIGATESWVDEQMRTNIQVEYGPFE